MQHPRRVRLGLAAIVLAAAPLVHAQEAGDTFSVVPQQSVTFGGDNDSDSFAVEQISPHDNTVTVLLRPKGESCNFRFDVIVGRSVQLRTGGPSGETLLCKATLRTFAKDGSAEFGAECSDQPVVDTAPKCPVEGDTAAAYPQQ